MADNSHTNGPPVDREREAEPLVITFDAVADHQPRTGPRTANELLHYMRMRQKYLGSPLPEGFVAPPGIDVQELLRQLTPPAPRPDAPPTA